MEITHVIRGEEWLPSAPLHVLLYRFLGWADTMPRFAHLPLLLKPQGNGKLSKRDGDKLGFPVFPLEWTDPKTGEKSKGYREEGYLPEAVINFLALLGWHPSSDQEMFTMDELIKEFSLDRVSKSGAKFDFEKGKWFNHEYLEKKDNNDLAVYLKKELDARGIKATDENIAKAAGHAKARANFANELWEQASFFFIAPESYDEKTAKKRWKAETPEIMSQLYTVFEGIFSLENTEKIVTKWIEEKGYGMGAVMNPLRLALVGESKGPHMFDITEILGKEETLRRLKKAIEVIPVSE